jgi:hypothetical protein
MACSVVGLCSCKPAASDERTDAVADKAVNAPARAPSESQGIDELKSRLWEAVRAKSPEKFVDCYFIESRFDTPEVREENRKQVEILFGADITDIEIREIPEKELAEIMKIQKAKPETAVHYSLDPRKMLWVRQRTSDGTVGRGFLIGERNGKWHIITLAGHTT